MLDIDTALEDIVPHEEFLKFEQAFQAEGQGGNTVSRQTQFNYAWCLIRSKHKEDILRGIILLEDLATNSDPESARDYLYCLAFANIRLKEFERAHDCIQKFLAVEPNNRQAQELEARIRSELTKEGIKGMVVTGTAAAAASLLAGIAFAAVKKFVFKM